MYTPVNPIKVGFKGVKIIQACFGDGHIQCIWATLMTYANNAFPISMHICLLCSLLVDTYEYVAYCSLS